MIRGLTGGRYVTVSNGSSSPTYINSTGSAQGVGNLRYNTATQALEVYDGNFWVMIHQQYPAIDLTSEASELLDWAKKRRSEERELDKLMEQHPGLKDLHEKFNLMWKLVQEEPVNDAK